MNISKFDLVLINFSFPLNPYMVMMFLAFIKSHEDVVTLEGVS